MMIGGNRPTFGQQQNQTIDERVDKSRSEIPGVNLNYRSNSSANKISPSPRRIVGANSFIGKRNTTFKDEEEEQLREVEDELEEEQYFEVHQVQHVAETPQLKSSGFKMDT